MTNIFIMDGMTFALREARLRDGTDDKPILDVKFEIAYDACIAWARIALRHRCDAVKAMNRRRHIWADASAAGRNKGESLEEEFQSSMQAVVAAATCLDAFYDHILPLSPICDDTKKLWRQNRTSRAKQVSEVVRTTFKIPQNQMKTSRNTIINLYRLRDSSLHPSSTPQPAFEHPELDIATDWRIAAFRGDVADLLVCQIVGLLWDLTRYSRSSCKRLTDFQNRYQAKLDQLLPGGKPASYSNAVRLRMPRTARAAN
ncbi:MAG TPA: hypothetical protein VK090_01955 [Paracoccaceae bacterium]|nr:hypothetical protein [Paracoccaceae bacterium]